MNTTPVHDPFFDTDTSPSGWNGQPMDLIPPRFQELGTLSFLGRGAVGSVFRIRGDEDLALKVIPCGTDEGRFQSAQIPHGKAAEIFADNSVQPFPERERLADRRTGAGRAALLEAGYGSNRTVCRLQDIQNADLFGRSGKPIAAAFPAHAFYELPFIN